MLTAYLLSPTLMVNFMSTGLGSCWNVISGRVCESGLEEISLWFRRLNEKICPYQSMCVGLIQLVFQGPKVNRKAREGQILSFFLNWAHLPALGHLNLLVPGPLNFRTYTSSTLVLRASGWDGIIPSAFFILQFTGGKLWTYFFNKSHIYLLLVLFLGDR